MYHNQRAIKQKLREATTSTTVAVERTVAELQPDVIHILVKLLLEEALFERFKQSLEKKV